jgi:putative inorganic carbon (HCO3(-)) transporter
MGFALTILYIVATIISPEQFGKEWASYHALMYLAGMTAVASLPGMAADRNWRSSVQTFLLLGLIVAIALSQVAHGWLGGVLESWRMFLPSAAVFFFIVVNVTTVRKLKIVTLAAVASCLIVTVEALCGYYAGFHGEMFILQTNVSSPQDEVIGQLTRIRGAGFLSDPNDLAQILLIALPLAFIVWRRGRVVVNFFVVLVPAALLLWTTYLTHSRGGLIALAAIALMVARKKLGTPASAALAGVLILGMLALDFTGGRGISAADGADRLEAWANGLEMFKSAPLFGIGFNGFTDLYEITAHNSFVLCLAELGILGSTLWVALLVTTTTSLNHIIKLQEKMGAHQTHGRRLFGLRRLFETSYISSAGALAAGSMPSGGILALKYECVSEPLPAMLTATGKEIAAEFDPGLSQNVPQQWVVAMRLALVSFMTTAWFLSRSYTTTMYLVLGLATATIALQGRAAKPRERVHWIFSTLATEGLLIIVIYCLVRLRH